VSRKFVGFYKYPIDAKITTVSYFGGAKREKKFKPLPY
jgi:hypothetical protein